jgi:TonB family protein
MAIRLENKTRAASWLLALAALTTISGRAQQAPSPDDGPLSVAPADVAPPPHPFSDGTYPMGPAITPPRIIDAVPAVYPANESAEGLRGACIVSLTIDADGLPQNAHIVHSLGDAFDAAAMEAVRRSKFEPGSWNDHPVSVRTHIRVRFSADHTPAIPAIFQLKMGGPGNSNQVDVYPVPIHTEEAVYSEEARRKKISGVVTVSALVGVDGVPSDLRVEKSMGCGLDEKAMLSVSQYRFKPAMKDGKPVAYRLQVQVMFKIY